MQIISESYRSQNRQLHELRVDYGIGGERYAEQVAEICRIHDFKTALDFGAGKQTFSARLRSLMPEISTTDYDPAIPGIDREDDLSPCDIVVCSDVLEHVEPHALYDVLKKLHYLTRRAFFFVIACYPSSKHLPDGRNAHLLINPPEWWIEKMERHFEMVDYSFSDKILIGLARPLMEIGAIPTKAAVADEERADNIVANCAYYPGRLNPCLGKFAQDEATKAANCGVTMAPNNRKAILACYGPSLQDTWPSIKLAALDADTDIISCSGAYRFLRDHGITPYAHTDVDPRQHKAIQIGEIGPNTEFWLASCVNLNWQERVPRERVKLWHAANGQLSNEVSERIDPGRGAIAGGGSIGARTVALLYFLGYRDIVIHGMDCSFRESGKQWAGNHLGKQKQEMDITIRGKRFLTSPALIAYARYFHELLAIMPGLNVGLAGNGLLQTMYGAE